MERGAIEIIVRRKLDFLKHSMKLAPSVSRRTSSSVRTIAAIRFSTSSVEYPRVFRAFAALASLPLLRSHHGDLEESVFSETHLRSEQQKTYSGMNGQKATPTAQTPY